MPPCKCKRGTTCFCRNVISAGIFRPTKGVNNLLWPTPGLKVSAGLLHVSAGFFSPSLLQVSEGLCRPNAGLCSPMQAYSRFLQACSSHLWYLSLILLFLVLFIVICDFHIRKWSRNFDRYLIF